jgi:uncharacterized cupredoxin-like copper-binding protein
VGAAGYASATAPHRAVRTGASENLSVTVGTSFSFTISADEVTPGDNVSVTITQIGTTDHTFTLLNAPNFQFNYSASGGATDSSNHIMGFLAKHTPLVNVSIPGVQGTYTASFIAPPLGLYEYLCLKSGHFQAGMWGILGSGEHGSAGVAANTGPGAPVFIIAGTIAGLVVLALVLGFVVGRRRGAAHEMPPERLGYREPTAPAEKK